MTSVYLGSFMAALTVALLATPLARTMAIRFGFLDIPAARKLHVNPVPYLGGTALILAFCFAVGTGTVLGGFKGAYTEIAGFLAAALVMAGVGLWDDLRNLPVAPRMVAQVAAGAVVYAVGIRVQLFESLPAADFILTTLWIFAVTNAMNLLDNMDGLSAGIAAIAAGFFFCLAALSGQYLVAGLAIGLLGCSLGFLWYNRPPARIFMGDSGSLFLGFVLAVLGIKLEFQNLERVTFFVPVAVMGVPMLDMAVVVVSRLRSRRSPFKGGRDHLSHRLIEVGIPRKAALSLLYFAALGSGWAGATIAYARPVTAYMVMGGLVVLGAFFAGLLLRVPLDEEQWRGPRAPSQSGQALRRAIRPVHDRPTVVRLITRLNIGGPAGQALLLTKALSDEYNTVLAAGRPAQAESELADPRVKPIYLPLVRRPSPLKDLSGLGAARRLMRTQRPQLVHTHTAKAGALGRLAALKLDPRPVIIHTFHGHVLDGYFGPLGRESALRTERFLAARTDVLVAVSEQIKLQLLELQIGTEEQWRVIPVGIDLSRHEKVRGPSGALRDRFPVPEGVPLLGVVGRLAPIKDHATLLTALVAVPDAHLAVIGDGALRRGLERLVRSMGLQDRVHFTGWMLDIPAVMSDLDLVVLTSANEGTPVSLIEALACGRPVAATAVGGVPSVVEDGKNGYLFPSRDPREIADIIREILNSLDHAQTMARAARGDILRRFGQERLVADIRQLYREWLGHPEPPLHGDPTKMPPLQQL